MTHDTAMAMHLANECFQSRIAFHPLPYLVLYVQVPSGIIFFREKIYWINLFNMDTISKAIFLFKLHLITMEKKIAVSNKN